MDLLDDDLDGQISFTQTDTPLEEVFNGTPGLSVMRSKSVEQLSSIVLGALG